MANAAAKKATKAGKSASSKYLQFIVASTVLYIGIRIIYIGPSFLDILFLFIYSGVYAVCYYGLVESAQNKVHSEIYFDMFVVVFVSEVVSSFSYLGRFLLLLIPAYLSYLGIAWYVGTKKNIPSPAEEKDESDTKKSDKASSRKQKIKYANR